MGRRTTASTAAALLAVAVVVGLVMAGVLTNRYASAEAELGPQASTSSDTLDCDTAPAPGITTDRPELTSMQLCLRFPDGRTLRADVRPAEAVRVNSDFIAARLAPTPVKDCSTGWPTATLRAQTTGDGVVTYTSQCGPRSFLVPGSGY